MLRVFDIGLQDLGKDLDEMLGGDTVFFTEPLQLLFCFGRELPHAFGEHPNDLIACRDRCLMNKAHEESEVLGRQKVREI